MGTGGPLSSITQKLESRREITLPATEDVACSPDLLPSWPTCHSLTRDALLLWKSQGTFPWTGRLQGGTIFSFLVFSNPASRMLYKHAVKPNLTPKTSVHISHHCTQTLLHKPELSLTPVIHRHLTRPITTTAIIISMQK